MHHSSGHLYLLLTGTPPIADRDFLETSVAEKCVIICNEEPPRPSQRVGARTLGTWIVLLARTRSDAIQILNEMIQDFLQHEFSRKMLITLLLLEGRSQRLQRQIEQARLLFPRSVDVELAEGLALAFRGDRRQVEWHVDRLKSMDLLSARDREFQEKFLLLLTRISETVLSFDFDSNTNSVSDLVTDIVELKQALSTLEVAHTL